MFTRLKLRTQASFLKIFNKIWGTFSLCVREMAPYSENAPQEKHFLLHQVIYIYCLICRIKKVSFYRPLYIIFYIHPYASFPLDRNECLDGSHSCKTHEICMNKRGSYECHCNEGYSRDGKVCKRMFIIYN